jgi:hypothetical protein
MLAGARICPELGPELRNSEANSPDPSELKPPQEEPNALHMANF